MPRKPTGNPRGAPRQYKDTRLCIELWRRVLNGRAKSTWAAAQQIEVDFPDGRYREKWSMARRIYNKAIGERKDWFIAQAQVRPAARKPYRNSFDDIVSAMVNAQREFERLSQWSDAAAQIIERQRQLERFAQTAVESLNLPLAARPFGGLFYRG
jgi:hypothetical protein